MLTIILILIVSVGLINDPMNFFEEVPLFIRLVISITFSLFIVFAIMTSEK